MNRIKAGLVILFCSGLLAACSSTPTWKGMSENEIAAWRTMGVEAAEAQTYRKAGLDYSAIEAWRGAGLSNSEAILDWHKAGWTPETAKPWLNARFDLESAIEWQKEKFTATQARKWVDGGFSLRKAKENRAKGLAPVS